MKDKVGSNGRLFHAQLLVAPTYKLIAGSVTGQTHYPLTPLLVYRLWILNNRHLTCVQRLNKWRIICFLTCHLKYSRVYQIKFKINTKFVRILHLFYLCSTCSNIYFDPTQISDDLCANKW